MVFSRIFICALNSQMRPERRGLLRRFAGRVVALRAGPFRFSMRVSESGQFTPVHAAVCADAQMEAADEFFPDFAAGKKAKTRVSGDPEFLKAVGEALRGAAMDFEARPAAAPVVMTARAARRAAQVWTPRAGSALVKSRAVPAPEAVSQFNRKVDNLTRAVARMEAAVDHLRQKAKQ